MKGGTFYELVFVMSAVRHYAHMHSMELGKDPKVKSVAKLVAQVRVHHQTLSRF